jgi:hypothetical protein
MARHTLSGVSGMSILRTPYSCSASSTALTMAAADASRLPSGTAAGALDAAVPYEREAITIPNACHAAEAGAPPRPGS